MKRIIFLFFFAVILMSLSVTAYAADSGGASSVAITVVIPQSETKTEAPTPAPTQKPPEKYLYPVSVSESQESGQREIIKTYELGANEKPDDISRESFTRGGYMYELTDIIRKETASADTREYIELVEQFSDTNNTEAILKLFGKSYEFINEDGYMGVMTLDISTLKVETAGTKSSSYTVTATREYPHLSSNDTSLIPKTITDSGRTLTLSNVEWKVQNYTTIDYDRIPDSYTALATYTGTASKTTVTGYTATAEYKGTLTKIITGKTMYTAYFLGVPIMTPSQMSTPVVEPETTETPTPEPSAEPVAEPTETEQPTIETEPPIEPETETEPDVKPNKDNRQLGLLLIILAVLAGACIGGSVIFLYHQKTKTKIIKEAIEDEETID